MGRESGPCQEKWALQAEGEGGGKRGKGSCRNNCLKKPHLMTAGRWGTGRGVRVGEAGKEDRASGWNWASHPTQDTKAAVTTLRFTEVSTLRKRW